jgi:hypothetical protein
MATSTGGAVRRGSTRCTSESVRRKLENQFCTGASLSLRNRTAPNSASDRGDDHHR